MAIDAIQSRIPPTMESAYPARSPERKGWPWARRRRARTGSKDARASTTQDAIDIGGDSRLSPVARLLFPTQAYIVADWGWLDLRLDHLAS